MLASPLPPPSRFADNTSYRPAKDLDAFNNLLPAKIEFVEGSSSGVLAAAEGKYQPINEGPRKTVADSQEPKKALSATSDGLLKSKKSIQDSPNLPKTLHSGSIETSWPSGGAVASGFNNTGNTCFLNSALQCLLHTPPLLHILLKHSGQDPCPSPKNAYCMICALRQVMSEAFSKRHSITPYPIITKLATFAKHLRRGRQEDSHEFLRYFVDALQRSALAGFPPKLDPKLAETTWVYKIFGGLLRSRVTCLSCGYNSDTFDRILDLSVDIAGVASLRDALRKFVAIDHLRGADKYKCEKCKKPVNADKQFTVQEAPMVLTVHLKRFSPMGRKIGHPVKYEERVSLEPFMSDGQFGPTYSLYGVISHAGGGPNSGHYYAHVKAGNGVWYEMNDESVMRQSSAATGMRNAYILFYIRDKGQALEAALNAPSTTPTRPPARTNVVASMKKRKAVESENEDERPSPAKTPKHFIGPQLPTVATSPQTPAKAASKTDPQAEALKKKIATATTQKGSGALQSLAEYTDDDDDDDDVGERVTEKESKTEKENKKDATAADPAATAVSTTAQAATATHVSSVRPTSPAPTSACDPLPSSSTSSTPIASGIPPSSFYATPSPKRGDKKRKTLDGEEDDASYTKWARTHISPTSSSKERRSSQGPRVTGANPYTKITGANNLHQRRETMGSPALSRHGHKRGFLM